MMTNLESGWVEFVSLSINHHTQNTFCFVEPPVVKCTISIFYFLTVPRYLKPQYGSNHSAMGTSAAHQQHTASRCYWPKLFDENDAAVWMKHSTSKMGWELLTALKRAPSYCVRKACAWATLVPNSHPVWQSWAERVSALWFLIGP